MVMVGFGSQLKFTIGSRERATHGAGAEVRSRKSRLKTLPKRFRGALFSSPPKPSVEGVRVWSPVDKDARRGQTECTYMSAPTILVVLTRSGPRSPTFPTHRD